MSDEWQSIGYSHLKGKPPTERQLKHLKEILFYEGPEITDAYEASQLIDILQADPALRLRREYENRLKEGPSWMGWEKWMPQSRKQYEKEQWQRWWAQTRKYGHEAGIIPVQTPPMPAAWKGSNYSTVEELMSEIRELLGVPSGGEIRLELSVGSREEAIEVKSRISEMRENLRTIEEDAAWIAAAVRSAYLGDEMIGELFEANAGGRWRGVRLSGDQHRVLKKSLKESYARVRGVVKTLNKQMREFLIRVNEVYKK